MNTKNLSILNKIYNRCMYYDSSTMRHHVEVLSDYVARKYFNRYLQLVNDRVKAYIENGYGKIPELNLYEENMIEIVSKYAVGIFHNSRVNHTDKYKLLFRFDSLKGNNDYLEMVVLYDNSIISIYVLFERNMNLYFRRMGYMTGSAKYCNDVESALNQTNKTGI